MASTFKQSLTDKVKILDEKYLLKLLIDKEIINKKEVEQYFKSEQFYENLLKEIEDEDENFRDDEYRDILDFLKTRKNEITFSENFISIVNQSNIFNEISKVSVTESDISEGYKKDLSKSSYLTNSYLKSNKYKYSDFYTITPEDSIRRSQVIKSLYNDYTDDENNIKIKKENPFIQKIKSISGSNDDFVFNNVFLKKENNVFFSANPDYWNKKTGEIGYFVTSQKSNSSLLDSLDDIVVQVASSNFLMNKNNFNSKILILNKVNTETINEFRKNPEMIPVISVDYKDGALKYSVDENFIKYFDVKNQFTEKEVFFNKELWKLGIKESSLLISENKEDLFQNYKKTYLKDESIYYETLKVLNTINNLPHMNYNDFVDLFYNESTSSKLEKIEKEISKFETLIKKLTKEEEEAKKEETKLKKRMSIDLNYQKITCLINEKNEINNGLLSSFKDVTNKPEFKNFLEQFKNWNNEVKKILNINENTSLEYFFKEANKANKYLESIINTGVTKILEIEYNMMYQPELKNDYKLLSDRNKYNNLLLSRTGENFESLFLKRLEKISKIDLDNIDNLSKKIKSAKTYGLKDVPEKNHFLNKYTMFFDLETGDKSSETGGISQFTALVFEKDKNEKIVNSFFVNQFINPEMNMKGVIDEINGEPVFGEFDNNIVAYTKGNSPLKEEDYKTEISKNPKIELFDKNGKEIKYMFSHQKEEAVEVHKLSNEMVSKEKGFWYYQQDIVNLFDNAKLYAHNGIKFDIPFIKNQLKKYQNEEQLKLDDFVEIIDTRDVSKLLIPSFIIEKKISGLIKENLLKEGYGKEEDIDDLRLFTLDNLCRFYKLNLDERQEKGHDARIDVALTAKLNEKNFEVITNIRETLLKKEKDPEFNLVESYLKQFTKWNENLEREKQIEKEESPKKIKPVKLKNKSLDDMEISE